MYSSGIYIYMTHCLPWLSKGSHNLSHICDWKYFRSWHNNLMWFFEPMNKHVLIPYEANPSRNSIPWWIYPIHMDLMKIGGYMICHFQTKPCYTFFVLWSTHSANGSFLAAMSCWKRGNQKNLLGCPTALKGTSPSIPSIAPQIHRNSPCLPLIKGGPWKIYYL